MLGDSFLFKMLKPIKFDCRYIATSVANLADIFIEIRCENLKMVTFVLFHDGHPVISLKRKLVFENSRR